MSVIETGLVDEAVAWRRDLHAHPELGFQEKRTSAMIAGLLEGWGLRVTTGFGGTGVVATLGDGGGRSVGIRADIDALPITEETGLAYGSRSPGTMHACGHDGHTSILLLAARLAARQPRKGTVHFIFQPAEENDGGARVMVQDGLFDRAPCDAVYALHNWPDLPVGQVHAGPGPMMAAFARFDITVRGRGGHAAMPHKAAGVISATAAIASALHELPARRIDPLDPAVLTVTRIQAGSTWNVSPEVSTLSGTARWFAPETGEILQREFHRAVTAIAQSQDCTAEIDFQVCYPATINTAPEAALVGQAAVLAGLSAVEGRPSMASEDFAFMLEQRPGAYAWLGARREGENPGLHSPRFDFNDALIPQGAALWLRLIDMATGG